MDSEWLGSLVDRYAAVLELYARQWCDAPEDVVQEAFLKLVAQQPLTRPTRGVAIPGGPQRGFRMPRWRRGARRHEAEAPRVKRSGFKPIRKPRFRVA